MNFFESDCIEMGERRIEMSREDVITKVLSHARLDNVTTGFVVLNSNDTKRAMRGLSG